MLEKIDPWGPKRADYRAAKICQAMAGGKIKDILKQFDFSPPAEQDDEDIEEMFERRI